MSGWTDHQRNRGESARPGAGRFAPRRLALALEQRFMFDAAGAATAEAQADQLADPMAPPAGGDAGLVAALVQNTAGVAQAATQATGPSAATPVEIVAIDTAVQGWEALRDAAPPQAEIILLDPARDGLTQLVEALEGRSNISALHVLSHGGEGRVQLGSLTLDAAAVEARAADLAALGAALGAEGDLLLYGCRVASGEGQSFLEALTAATGADVAASTNDTGPTARGGDWTLEQRHGQVETVTLEIAAFGGLLNGNNTVNLTGTTNVTFTDGTVDLARFPATPPAHGGHYYANSTELFNIAVVSGFNAAEDFIDLRATDISTQFAQFTADIYDIGNADYFGTDTRYTSFSPTGPFLFQSGNSITSSGGTPTIAIGYTSNNVFFTFAAFINVTGTITAANFLLPGDPDPAPATPNAPSAPDLAAGSDSGSSSTDNLTNANSLTFTGTGADANGTVRLYRGGTQVASATADGSGNYSFSNLDVSGLADGSYSFTARQFNGSAESTDSTALNITIDRTAPTVTSITRQTPANEVTNADSVTWRVSFDGAVTGVDAGDFSVSGTTATLGVTSAGGNAFDVTASGGNLSALDGTVTLAFAGGQDIADAAGNALTNTAPSGANQASFTLDNSPPPALGQIDLAAASDSGASDSDDLTNATSLTFTGTGADAGATVRLYRATTLITSTTADGAGNFTFSNIDVSALSDAGYSFSARQLDAAGNESVAGTALVVTIDRTAPNALAAPDLDAAADSGASSTDNITNANAFSVTGTGTANATLRLYRGGTQVASTTVDGTGNWSITGLDVSGLGDGVHLFTARELDAAGNESADSTALTVVMDRTAPSTPSVPNLTAATDSGASDSDNITRELSLAFNGSGTPNTAVSLYRDGNLVTTTTTNGSGNFLIHSVDVSSLPDGTYAFTALQVDAAGNASAASAALQVTIDNTAPGWNPTEATQAAENGTAVMTLAATDANSYSIIGGDDAARFTVTGNVLTFATAPNFEAPADTGADNSYVVTLRATDLAGNTTDQTLTVQVQDRNDPPTLTATAANPAFTEGGTAVALFTSPSASTVETGQSFDRLVLTIGQIQDGAAEFLTANGTELALVAAAGIDLGGGLTADITRSGASATVTLSHGTGLDATALQALVVGLAYRHGGDVIGAATRPVTITALRDSGADGGGHVREASLSLLSTVALTAVNDAPVLAGTVGASWSEGGALAGSSAFAGTSVALFTSPSVTDPDQPSGFAGATLTVAFAAYQGGDLITLPASQGALTYDSVQGTVSLSGTQVATVSGGFGAALVITFNGDANAAAVNTVMGNILYNFYGGDDPTAGGTAGSRAITATFRDGGNTGGGALDSNSLTGTLTLTASNDAEALGGAVTSSSWTEGAVPIALFDTPVLTAVDAPNLDGGSLTLALGAYRAGDVLSIADGHGITRTGANLAFNGQSIGTASGGAAADLVISLTGTDATHAAVQALIGQLRFASTSDDPTAGGSAATRAVTLTLADGGRTGGSAQTSVLTGTLGLVAVNDAPVIATNTGGATETSGLLTITTALLNEGDPDDGGAGLTFTATTLPTGGTLFLDGNDNGQVDGGEALSANGSFTQADLEAGRLKYRHGGAAGTADSFTFSLADGGEDGAAPLTNQVFSITVAERPVITPGSGSVSYTEDGPAAAIAPGLSIADADSPNLSGATVTITDRAGGDVLGFTDQGGITGSYHSGTGVLTLTGTATRAAYEQALRSVTFSSTSNNPASGSGSLDRVVEFRVTDSGGLTSVVGTSRTVDVANANDAPTVTDGANATLTGTDEDTTSAATTVAALLTAVGFADVDNGALTGLAITGATGRGEWQVSTDGGQHWSALGAVSAASARLLGPNAELRYIPDEANAETATLAFRGWDQTTGSAGGTADTTTSGGASAFSSASAGASLVVTAVNDAPTLTLGATVTLAGTSEDSTATPFTVASLLTQAGGTDVDSGTALGIAITAASGRGTWQVSTDGGANWAALGSVSAGAARLLGPDAQLRYQPDAQRGETASLGFRAWDASAGSAGGLADTAAQGGSEAFSLGAATASLSVTEVNDAPVLGAGSLALTGTHEDAASSGTSLASILAALGASDVDAGALSGAAISGATGNGTWQVSQDGGASWTALGAVSAATPRLLAADAQLRYLPDARNGETASLTLRAWDRSAGQNAGAQQAGGSGALSGTLAVLSLAVSPRNDAPVVGGVVTAQSGSDAAESRPFNAIQLSDVDLPGDVLTVTLLIRDGAGTTGEATGRFTEASLSAAGVERLSAGSYRISGSAEQVTAALRLLAFRPTADQALPGSSVTTRFVLSVTDGAAPVAAPEVALAVASVNDAPVVAGSPPASQSTRADLPFRLNLPVSTFADADLPGGDALAFSLSGPAGLALTRSGEVLTLSAASGALRPGSYTVTLEARDLSGAAASTSFTLTVQPSPPPVPAPAPAPPPPAPPPPAPPAAPPAMPVTAAMRGGEATPIVNAPLGGGLGTGGGFGGGFGSGTTGGGFNTAMPATRNAEPATSGGFLRLGGGEAGTGRTGLTSVPDLGSAAAGSGTRSVIPLPSATFNHSDPGAQVSVSARQANGQPLPNWVQFDPSSGTLVVQAPPGTSQRLVVEFTARDGQGREATTRMEVVVGADGAAATPRPVPPPPAPRAAAPAETWLSDAPLTGLEALAERLDLADQPPQPQPGLTQALRAAGAQAQHAELLRLMEDLIRGDEAA